MLSLPLILHNLTQKLLWPSQKITTSFFQIKSIDDIPDYNEDQGRQKIPDEFNTMLNRKFVFKVQISKFNHENNYHAYIVHKMTDDELVVDALFKHSPAYEENIIHSDGTPINKSIKENNVSVKGDNINVVDLDAVTPTTTSLKHLLRLLPPLNRLNGLPQKMVLLLIPLRFQKWKNSNKFSSNDVAALLNKVGLIIWDEALMMHRHCFEAANRTLTDIILPKNNDKPFRCKTIVFGGTIGGPNDGEVKVEFPEDVTVPSTSDHIHSIVKPPPAPEVVISSGLPRSNVGGAVPTGSFSRSAIDKKWFE
ncbi:unnamed protein product [Lactuca saligna]|uniref:ATP-dependent DNA helicase n=1 Tax=Lactuca saligna TaxID=75948 RepID=A0AA36EIE1_LACSI|nr:unnamed protein product [Lactuca saligna]